jgi:molybdopterin-binding protein
MRERGANVSFVPHMRIREAAAYLGVSDDTVRRWIDRGLLRARTDDAGRKVVDGYEVAMVARDHASPPSLPPGLRSSARNRFVGLVTDIKADAVMAQVELQCGPFRVVSLMSSEAVRDLGLEPGSVAVAVIKSTNVVIETEGQRGSA